MKMSHGLCVVALFLVLALFVDGSKVRKCGGAKELQENPSIFVSNCKKPPCILKRNTRTYVNFTITPEETLEDVRNDVFAKILGLPFPFIGVNGTSTCGKFFDKETGQKVDCPLQPGRSYVYKDSFKILRIYPRLKLIVHWALKTKQRKEVLCFEVPARIV